MLPAKPKTFGILRHVLEAACAAVDRKPNRLGLPGASAGIVLLVDGLGVANIRAAGAHARNLNRMLEEGRVISTVFPSTTAAALTSLGTGEMPGAHGIVGYKVHAPGLAEPQNLLSGWPDFAASDGWRLTPALSQALDTPPITFIGRSEYERSGFTNIFMPGAKFLPMQDLELRFDLARRTAAQGKGGVIYLYVPELDKLAHSHGSRSLRWLELIERVDAAVLALVSALPRGVGFALTADHGVVDVPVDGHIEFAEFDLPGLRFFAGETRCAYLYFDATEGAERQAEQVRSAREVLTEELGERCWVVSSDELVEQGWLGEVAAGARARLPQLFVLARGDVALYHRDHSTPRSYAMVGHHGSITEVELRVPLLLAGAWAPR